jgi:hypothetical protein
MKNPEEEKTGLTQSTRGPEEGREKGNMDGQD